MADKKPFAAFTIVRNEPFFLPIWCSYYVRAFGEENIYVLDNSTSDASIERVRGRWPKINIKSVPSAQANAWAWTTDVVKSFQASALKAHDVVVYADADEFLIPKFTDLHSYCEIFRSSDRQYVRACGWGVIQNIDKEHQVDVTGPVLQDRREAWRTPRYDKTLISKIPLPWAKGLHTIYDASGHKMSDDPVDHDMSLVHLRDVDLTLLHQRSLERSKMVPYLDQYGCASLYHGSTNIEHLKTYFRTRVAPWNPKTIEEFTNEVQLVPEHWRRSIV